MKENGLALPTSYLVTTKNLEEFLNALKGAKAPDRVNGTFLKHLDFSSSNDRLFIGVLKSLEFVDDGGVPTKRYFEFLDQTRSGQILADALREAYADLFAVNTKAQELSAEDIKNKFRTLTQAQYSDNVLTLMAKTFKALTDLAEWNAVSQLASTPSEPDVPASRSEIQPESGGVKISPEFGKEAPPKLSMRELHYNIQIVLPETRDAAVFDAVFGSLRKHLIG